MQSQKTLITPEVLGHPLAKARLALASITSGKLIAGLARQCSDGRMRDTHVYYGAHTSRWTQRGMQLHNLPRGNPPKPWNDDAVRWLADRALAGERISQRFVQLLIRACIIPRAGHTLVVRDFSGIEARGLSWAVCDEPMIEAFRNKSDIYKAMASTIFGVPVSAVTDLQRGIGKQSELACGYSMGSATFAARCELNGIDLAAAGVSAGGVVKAWRKKHPLAVRFWSQLESAFADAVAGKHASAGPFSFAPSDCGRHVAMVLPSGNLLVYRDADRVGRRLVYRSPKGRADVYGGLLAENAISSMSRDLMAAALVRAERDGLCPVLTVHDEIVCEVPDSASAEAGEYLSAIMCDTPEWAAGLPVNVEGYQGKRYRK